MTQSDAPIFARADGLLVGHDDEVHQLRGLLAEAEAGRSRVVLLSGPAGIGKTYLASRLAHEAEGRGVLVLSGRCFEGAPVPLMPIADAVQTALGDSRNGHVSDKLRTIASSMEPASTTIADGLQQSSVDQSGWVIKHLADGLLYLAEDTQTVVCVDDIHWADRSLLTLLEYLAHRLTVSPIGRTHLLIACTCRDEFQTDAVAGLGHAPATEVLRLGALSTSAISDVVRHVSGQHADRALAAQIASLAAGNPLYAATVTSYLRDTGALRRPNDLSAADIVRVGTLPVTLDDAVRERISALSYHAREIVECLAVIGPSASLQRTAKVAEARLPHTRASLDEAVRAQLVSERAGDLYEFRHPVFRHAILNSTRRDRTDRLHLRAARLFGGLGDDPISIAEHLVAARDIVPSDEYLVGLMAGARHAVRVHSWIEASRLFDAILARPENENVEIRVLAGRSHMWAYAPKRAAEHFERAQTLAAELQDADLTVDAIAGSARVKLMGARVGTALDVDALNAAIADLNEEHPVHAALLHCEVALASWAGSRLEDARSAANNAIALATANRSVPRAKEAESRGYSALGLIALTMLQPRRAVTAFETALELANEEGSDAARVSAVVRLPAAKLLGGEVSGVESAALLVEKIAEELGVPADIEFANVARMTLAYMRGECAEGDRLAGESAALARLGASNWTADLVKPARCMSRAVVGDLLGYHRARDEMIPPAVRGLAEDVPASRLLMALMASEAGDHSTMERLRRTDHPAEELGNPAIDLVVAAADIETRHVAGLRGDSGWSLSVLRRAHESGARVIFGLCMHVGRLVGLGELGAAQRSRARQILSDVVDEVDESGLVVEGCRARLDLALLEGRQRRSQLIDEAVAAMSEYALRGLWHRLARVAPDVADSQRDVLGPLVSATAGEVDEFGDAAIVMIADVVGSTRTTERLGDAGYLALHRRLELMLLEEVAQNKGSARPGITLGDGVCAVFPDADDAILAAVTSVKRAEQIGLPLHVGLSAGRVLIERDRAHGGAINVAARVSDRARSGEVLVTAQVVDLSRNRSGIRFEARGPHVLRNLGAPVHLFQVVMK